MPAKKQSNAALYIRIPVIEVVKLRAAAKREGVTYTYWMRRAFRESLERHAQDERDK